MKKFFMIAVFSACAFAGYSQDNGGKKLSFSAGIDAGLPMGDFGDAFGIAVGATVQGAYALTDKAGITLRTGYMSYSGKDGGDALGVIPVMAGVKYGFTDKLYAHGHAGMSFWSLGSGDTKVSESDFTWNLGVGYNITSNIDASLYYNSIGTEGSASNAVGLRVAYNF